MLCFCRSYKLEVDKFAELWAASKHEYKATVTTGRMEISGVCDIIVSKCHMAVIQMTGTYCGAVLSV